MTGYTYYMCHALPGKQMFIVLYINALHVNRLRSDKGGEKHERTIPKTPQQNGVAERLNRTLIEMVRTMLANC